MPFINFVKREIKIKIVYYGPPNSGKLTNIRHLYNFFPESRRRDIGRMAVDGEDAVYTELLGPEVFKGYQTVFTLIALTGYSGYTYDKAHQVVTHKADGFIFVGDAGKERVDYNHRFLNNLVRLISKQKRMYRFTEGKKGVPVLIQWNKMDADPLMPFEDFFEGSRLKHQLSGADVIQAIASEGLGVYYSLKYCIDMMNIPNLEELTL